MTADHQDSSLALPVDDSTLDPAQLASDDNQAESEEPAEATQSENIDPRHVKRIRRMQLLFAHQASDGKSVHESTDFFQKFEELKAEIDQEIEVAAPEWPLDQMNQVDLAILRTILLEHKVKKTPVKVLIDEAIEIAREYGTESSPKFINGVLGKILIDSN